MNKKLQCFITLLTLVITLTGCSDLLSKNGHNEGKQQSYTTEKKESVPSIPHESDGKYSYLCLNEEEKSVYNEIYYTIINQNEKIKLSSTDENEVSKVFDFVLKDHPEIFWCESYKSTQYKVGNNVIKLEFTPIYTMSGQKRSEIEEQIKIEVDKCLQGIRPDADDYEKARYIYEYIVQNIDYNTEAEYNQTIVSAFIYKQTVCQGYAKAFQYLMDRLSIECVLVRGEANNEAHVWNLVRLDGEYYYIDATWGCTNFKDREYKGKYINYNYFCITTDELCRTHLIQEQLQLPECTAVADNYFVREGKFYSEFNPDLIGKMIRESTSNGETEVLMKFSGADIYAKAMKYLIEDKHVFDFYKGENSISFYDDSNYYVLTIFFE